MARVCSIRGSRVRSGGRINRSGLAKKKGGIGRHVTKVVKRKIKPNLQTKRIWVPELGRHVERGQDPEVHVARGGLVQRDVEAVVLQHAGAREAVGVRLDAAVDKRRVQARCDRPTDERPPAELRDLVCGVEDTSVHRARDAAEAVDVVRVRAVVELALEGEGSNWDDDVRCDRPRSLVLLCIGACVETLARETPREAHRTG